MVGACLNTCLVVITPEIIEISFGAAVRLAHPDVHSAHGIPAGITGSHWRSRRRVKAEGAFAPSGRRGCVDTTSFDRLVFELRDAQLRGSLIIRLLDELDDLPVQELVLDLHHVGDDLLPRVAAVARLLGTKRRIRIAGLRGDQMQEMTGLGIELQDIVIGRWPRTLPDVG
jgi:hypothetical protein